MLTAVVAALEALDIARLGQHCSVCRCTCADMIVCLKEGCGFAGCESCCFGHFALHAEQVGCWDNVLLFVCALGSQVSSVSLFVVTLLVPVDSRANRMTAILLALGEQSSSFACNASRASPQWGCTGWRG